MRLTVLRMLSSQSLSAFSAANAPLRPARPGGVRVAAATQVPGRAPTSSTASAAKPGTAPAAATLGSTPPTRTLPRGSLLDLSV